MFLLTISIQRLQPNSKAYAIRNVMYAKNNGYNLKLRIFSFIPQRRRIQPNFINDTYQTTNQTSTTQTTKTATSTWVSPQHKICALTTETAQILEYSYSNFNQFQKIHIQPISYISCITNLCISSIPKTCTCIDEQFRTFHPSLHESVTGYGCHWYVREKSQTYISDYLNIARIKFIVNTCRGGSMPVRFCMENAHADSVKTCSVQQCF